MTPIAFSGSNVVIAENQDPYIPLPAQCMGDKLGTVLTCWELSESELAQIQNTGKLWITFLTFNQPFQPICPSTEEPVR